MTRAIRDQRGATLGVAVSQYWQFGMDHGPKKLDPASEQDKPKSQATSQSSVGGVLYVLTMDPYLHISTQGCLDDGWSCRMLSEGQGQRWSTRLCSTSIHV